MAMHQCDGNQGYVLTDLDADPNRMCTENGWYGELLECQSKISYYWFLS